MGATADPGGEIARASANRVVTTDEDMHAIVCDGRLVALAAPKRCYFLTDQLTTEQFELATAMCLCSREVRAGRLEGPFTTELAEMWARIFLAL